jgi:penicillin-binding protein 2
MHVAGAMAALARGGEFRTPLLVDELASRQRVRRLGVAPELLGLVQEGMFRVVNSPAGTAYKHAHDPEVQICGKTGTGEAPPRREGIDDDGDGRIDRFGAVVRSGDMAWFAGFAPRDNPRIAIAILVEYSSEGGGRTCGPIARNVVRICRELGYL